MNSGELIRKWFEEVWNKGRESAIDEMCAAEAVGHGQTVDGSDIVGPAHFRNFWEAFRAAFSSIHSSRIAPSRKGIWRCCSGRSR